MAIKKIPISSLVPGMYITKLDISWIDSPFMYHHLMIKNREQVNKLLKAGVKKVSIDTSKGKDIEPECSPTEIDDGKTVESTELTGESNKTGSNKEQSIPPEDIAPTSIDQELGVAKELKGQVEALADEINKALKNDESVDVHLVSPLIDGTLSSLKRNNQALATLINIQRKDASLANHTFATFSLILSLSLKLEFTETEQETLGLASFFHDTGWLKLPLHLLGKKSPYSVSEKKLVEQHVAIGLKSLKQNCDLTDLVIRIIREHHEQLDGKGFPSGLTAEQIHPLSKVFSVVVRYDELVHGLMDRPAITPHGALAILYKEAKQGLHSEDVVSSLISLLSVYPVGSAVQLSNKEKGIVLETDNNEPKLPIVKVFYDASGMAHIKPKVVNLAKVSGDQALIVASVLDVSDPGVDPVNLLGIGTEG